MRLRFYLDLRDLCYPLFRGRKIDWTEWPWNMKDSSNSMEDNDDLYDFLTKGAYRYLRAAVCYDLKEQILGAPDVYTSVARNGMSDAYFYFLERAWKDDKKNREKNEGEEEKEDKLLAAINKFADKLWTLENHQHLALQMGLDFTAQAVYDAMDTFISDSYVSKQVDFAREFGAWINANWAIGERHPSEEKVSALHDTFLSLMKKHKVTTPELSYSWNIITVDLLGMSMFSEEEEEDDDPWGFKEYGIEGEDEDEWSDD